ncbi:unnamed protein product [Somion occarium]|uniref:Pentatricopeptide repeat-containing protein n=1 Tax=Somion occarium TaxID=3059160 RepID=A0ABP1DFF8_9APHY
MLASCSRNVVKGSLRTPCIIERNVPAVAYLQGRGQQHARTATRFRSRDSQNPYFISKKDSDIETRRPERMVSRPAAASPTAKANLELGRLCDRKRTISVFRLCQEMKVAGIRPDNITYDHLLSLCATIQAPIEAWAIFEDMRAMGIYPEREVFHYLIRAAFTRDIKDTWIILDLMEQYDIPPNNKTYELIISRMCEADNLESALQQLAEMNKLGLSPTLQTAEAIIRLACKLDSPRLALDLADAFEETAVRRLDGVVWMECLSASADALYADGVTRCWQKVVNDLNMLPDEGCCIAVLHTVARHKLTSLGMDVFRVLQSIGVAWEEYHFVPLIECFAGAGLLKEAFALLELMRTNGIEPLPESGIPIFKVIAQSVEALDEAWALLEDLHAGGKPVDVIALNTAIHAAASLGDLQRAIGIYKVFPDFGVKPTVDTYNWLLSGCIAVRHRELGDRLLSDMREANIEPNEVTYERLIILCATQTTYEDAFFYLEEMKTAGFKPPLTVYEAIIRKCVSNGDSRYKLAVDEMLEQGYHMLSRLNSFIASGGEHDNKDRSNKSEERRRLEHGEFL